MHFIVLSGRGDTILPEGTDVYIQQQNHEKYLNLCLTSYMTMPRLLMNWNKQKHGIQSCYGVFGLNECL